MLLLDPNDDLAYFADLWFDAGAKDIVYVKVKMERLSFIFLLLLCNQVFQK